MTVYNVGVWRRGISSSFVSLQHVLFCIIDLVQISSKLRWRCRCPSWNVSSWAKNFVLILKTFWIYTANIKGCTVIRTVSKAFIFLKWPLNAFHMTSHDLVSLPVFEYLMSLVCRAFSDAQKLWCHDCPLWPRCLLASSSSTDRSRDQEIGLADSDRPLLDYELNYFSRPDAFPDYIFLNSNGSLLLEYEPFHRVSN